MTLTSFRSIVLAAAAVSMTVSTTHGLAIYLKQLPNGDSFTQELGHPDNDSSQYTDFATAFAEADHTWSAELCAATFPGSTMTNGQAFGDPCCTWTVGGTPDFTVTAFTTSPTEATTCASSATDAPASTTAAPATTTAAPAATTAAPAATTAAPAATTAAPSTDSPSVTAATPSSSAPAAATKAPSTTTSPTTESPSAATKTPSSGGCSVKGNGGQKGHHSYSFRH